MKKKLFIWISIAIAVIAGLVYWFMPIVKNQKESEKQLEKVKIGVILPLSGKPAFVGKPIKNAIQLFLDDYNDSEKEIEVIFEDSKADEHIALSILQKFKSQNISLILGPVTSGEVLAVAPEAERNRMVILSPGASASKIKDAGDYIFRNELSDDLGAKAQAQLAIDALNWHKLAILYMNNDYGAGVLENFKQEYLKSGGEIVAVLGFDSGTYDFRTQLSVIKKYSFDALFVIAQDEYPLIIKQIRENGIINPIYATPVFEDEGFLQRLGKFAEGVYYTYYGRFDVNSSDDKCKDFVAKYKAKYHVSPSYYAALGYDNIGLMLEALKLVSFDQSEVKNGLYSIKGYKGVTGEMSFDKKGDVFKPVVLKKVVNGRFSLVENLVKNGNEK